MAAPEVEEDIGGEVEADQLAALQEALDAANAEIEDLQNKDKPLYGAAKAARERKAKGKALEPYPFHDGGVSENGAIRVIRMVIPNCPADPRPEIIGRDGVARVNPRYTGEPNCQEVYAFNKFGRWDIAKCESLGHDPWHTKITRRVVEDIVDERITLEDGSPNPDYGVVTEERTRTRVEKRLNVIQVSLNIRHSSSMDVALARARGAKFLEEFGIESPCEFRACSKKVTVDTRFGKFCSERHARLVGADTLKRFLPSVGASDTASMDEAAAEREDILEGINIRKSGAL